MVISWVTLVRSWPSGSRVMLPSRPIIQPAELTPLQATRFGGLYSVSSLTYGYFIGPIATTPSYLVPGPTGPVPTVLRLLSDGRRHLRSFLWSSMYVQTCSIGRSMITVVRTRITLPPDEPAGIAPILALTF